MYKLDSATSKKFASIVRSYRGSERIVIAFNPEVMDCGRKIDELTINVIVLRGAIRRNGIVARCIATRRAAAPIRSICLSE